MGKKCSDCRHFRQGSVGPTKPDYVWGDCLKVTKHPWSAEKAEKSVNFTWADGYCEKFEPRQMSAADSSADSR